MAMPIKSGSKPLSFKNHPRSIEASMLANTASIVISVSGAYRMYSHLRKIAIRSFGGTMESKARPAEVVCVGTRWPTWAKYSVGELDSQTPLNKVQIGRTSDRDRVYH